MRRSKSLFSIGTIITACLCVVSAVLVSELGYFDRSAAPDTQDIGAVVQPSASVAPRALSKPVSRQVTGVRTVEAPRSQFESALEDYSNAEGPEQRYMRAQALFDEFKRQSPPS